MNSMSDKPRINFPRDGERTAVIGTDLIAEMTKTRKWPCRGSMLCFMVTQINHQYMKLTSPLLLNNQIFTLWISAKINDNNQLDAQINIHSMILPRVRSFFVSLLHWTLTCFDYRGGRDWVLVLVSRSVSNAPAEVWLPSLLNASWPYAFCSYADS